METQPLLRTLVIEDNAAYAELLKEMLTQGASAFDVETAPSLSAALVCLGKGRYDLALLDLHLPDAQGPASYEALHASAPLLPVVIVSGSTEEEGYAAECLQKGAQDYLVKGDFDRRQLLRSARHAVQRKKMEVEYQATQAALVEANRTLVEKVRELDRLNAIMMGREEKILEMKEEIKKLSDELRKAWRIAS